MKNWWSDSELAETCGLFHCKYFGFFGCVHPDVKKCENGSLYQSWQPNCDKEDPK